MIYSSCRKHEALSRGEFQTFFPEEFSESLLQGKCGSRSARSRVSHSGDRLISSQVEALTLQQKETTDQLGDLKRAADPKPDELEKIQELDQSVAKEQGKLSAIEKSSAKMREQVVHRLGNMDLHYCGLKAVRFW